MPTALPRIQVTQTAPVAAALQVAAQRWPDAPRSEQLARLLTTGANALAESQREQHDTRRQALDAASGRIRYPDHYLDALRSEWPE